MEILLVFTIATILLIDILALKLLQDNLMNEINDTHMCIERTILLEHNKTRKEAQEIKTRLTQVRKDLNKIEHVTITQKPYATWQNKK